MWPSTSLKVRIAGVIFLLVAMLVAIGLAPLVLQQVTGNQREQALQRDTIVMLLREMARMELQAGGLDELRSYLKHVVHNPRVVHVLVAGRDGRVVADSDGLHLGQRLALPYGAPTLRWVTVPIRHNGSSIGVLAIAFQRTPGDLYRRRIGWIALVVALGATVLIAGTSLLLAGLLNRRTDWVVQALRQFGERTARGTVPPAGAAGQDDLARAFAEMAARVAAEHERLGEANRLLEQTVGELRAAEQAWERSERDYRLLLQHAHDGVVVTGADLHIVDANPSFCRLLGYTREEVVGRTYRTLLPPGEEQRQPLSYFRMPNGGSLLFDRRLQRSDGTVLTLEASCTRLDDGRAIGILRDVTERTAALGALAESEARYREIVETTHEGVWVIDADLRTTFVNQRMAEMLGYSPEEMLGRSSLEFMAPKELSNANQAVARSRAGQSEQSEWTLVRRDGEQIVVLANLTPRMDADGRHLGALGLFADITERKQAEADLARREREYRLLLENAYDAVLLVGRTNHIIEANPRACELLGYTREELLGLDYARLVDPADLERVPLQFERAFGRESVVLERRFVRKDGSLVAAELSSTCVDEWRVQTVIRDVTERKAAEAALRESEELSRTLLSAAFDGIVIHDNGTILETNPAYERMFGYSKAELLGQNLMELVIAPETRAAMQGRERNDERQFTEGMGLHKDGQRIYFEAVGRTHTYQGRRVRIVAVRDITERKQAEAALRESEQLSRTLLSAAFDGIVIHDNGTILETNPAYERMYGYSKAELLGLNLLEELIAPEARETLARAIGNADPYPIEGIGVRKDGRRIHFEAVGMTHWHQGRQVRVAAVRDITERKEAEAALRERERRLGEAHRIAHLGEWVWDIDADAFAMSDQLAEILGLAQGSHTREAMMAVVHPADHDRMAAAIADALDGGDALADFDFRVRRPDGTVRDLHARAHLVRDEAGRPVRLLGTTQDITERKAADAALRERETRLREAQAIAGLGDWEWDPETDEFNGSDELYRILDIPVDGSVRTVGALLPHVHPEDQPSVRDVLAQMRARSAESMAVEFRFRPAQGGLRHLYVQVRIADASDETPGRIHGVMQDITERKAAEAALREREARLREAQDIASLGDWSWNLEPDFLTLSAEAAGILGFSPHTRTLTSMDIAELVHPEDREHTRMALRDILKTTAVFAAIDLRIVRPDGTLCHLYLRMRIARGESGRVLRMVGTMQDLTERKELERQLAQAMKMEAIGKLTGGVAHDFNNLLTIVLGNLRMLERDGHKGDPLLGEALLAAERGSELVQRLLAYGRRQPLRAEPLAVNAMIAETTDLLRRTLGEPIQVEAQLADDLWPALTDRSQLETALINLAFNARDAMPEGGRLIITTANVDMPEQPLCSPSQRPGAFVRLSVADTGTGMTAEVLEHAFDPFFSTKEVGRGSGLGLSMVYGFAEQCGGFVQIRSAPSAGTTVELYLPRARDDGQAVAPANLAALGADSGNGRAKGGTILLVEDDPGVRLVTVRILQGMGYHVVDVPSGFAALRTLESLPAVDLLFTDIVMPQGLSGLDLARQARRVRPGLRVLLTTGYTDVLADSDQFPCAPWPLLPKPYGPTELERKLHEVLHAPTAPA